MKMASNSQETHGDGQQYYMVPAVNPPNFDRVKTISSQLGYSLPDQEIHKYTFILQQMIEPYNKVYRMVEPKPPVQYSRMPGVAPEAKDNPLNAWYVKTDIKGAPEGKLVGRTIAVKDNIAIAGVQMMAGSKIMEGYIPEFDASAVLRTLQAGGRICGKAACESLCMSSMSYTNDLFPILNPLDKSRTSGGSSSGCAALLAAGEVGLALGTDQGGSIRMPAACCGIVGFKPTFGLIPYTGGMSLEPTVDTIGPMARNVKDCALLLEVLAGSDGMDSRQPDYFPPVPCNYSEMLKDDALTGKKIGVLNEGFENCKPGVCEVVRQAVEQMCSLGAYTESISIPLHSMGAALWRIIMVEGGFENIISRGGFGPSATGFHSVTMMDHFKNGLERKPQYHPLTLKLISIMGTFMKEENNHQFYCRASNIRMNLTTAYNEKLKEFDVLVMPTIPIIAPKLPTSAQDVERCERESSPMLQNTSPFNLSGHPAITVNCGEVDGMPVGLMIVGKKWDDLTVLNVAHAYERSRQK